VLCRSLGAYFQCCERLPDALCVALIVLHLVLYTVFAGELVVTNSAVAAIFVATLSAVYVSITGLGAYKLQSGEQLTANSATFSSSKSLSSLKSRLHSQLNTRIVSILIAKQLN
jgi:hypothetical protein